LALNRPGFLGGQVAHINSGKEFTSKQVTDVAEAFYIWLESKKKA